MPENEVTFQHMSISQLHGVLTTGTHVVLDIRDPASFKSSHIPGAIHLSNDSMAEFLREADFDAPTVVCCYHGISSQQAAQFLVGQDFTDVYSLDGGFTDWQNSFANDVES